MAELLNQIYEHNEEKLFINNFLHQLSELQNNIQNFTSDILDSFEKVMLDLKFCINEFNKLSFFQKIIKSFDLKANYEILNKIKYKLKNYSKFYVINILEEGLGYFKIIYDNFGGEDFLRTDVFNNLILIFITIKKVLKFIKILKQKILNQEELYMQLKTEINMFLIKIRETKQIGEKRIFNGINKIKRILTNGNQFKKIEKTIFLFLQINEENNYFFQMLESNFKNTNIEWIDDPSEIKLLQERIKDLEFLSPFLIISSMKYFDLLNETDTFDSMFIGMIIYTQNTMKFKEINKNKNLNRINCITQDPYTVFEKAKNMIENRSLENNGTFFFNLYYIVSRFGSNTYQYLSAKILYFESLQKLSIFSLQEVLSIIGTSQRYEDFRKNYPKKEINKKNLIDIFQNDLSEYYQLFKETLPEIFINYYFKYPINPLDKFYDILHSNKINEQIINPNKQIESSIKREALLARADYLKILFDFMDILNKETNEKNKIVEILKLYTDESYHSKINNYFSLMNYEIIEHFKDFLGIFYYCFLKYENKSALPRKLYRSIAFDIGEIDKFKEQYKIGDRIVFPQFVSTSISKKACKEFGKFLFIINVDSNEFEEKKPKNLSKFSEFSQEKEYLFPCFSCFEILEINDSKKNGFEYECEIKQIIM